MAWVILVPGPGIELRPLAMKMWNLNQWLSGNSLLLLLFKSRSFFLSFLFEKKFCWDKIHLPLQYTHWASLAAQTVKSLLAMRETRVWFLGWEDSLEKGMATHSSILAWRIPWTEEPNRLYSPWGHKESDTTEWLTQTFKVYGPGTSLMVKWLRIWLAM